MQCRLLVKDKMNIILWDKLLDGRYRDKDDKPKKFKPLSTDKAYIRLKESRPELKPLLETDLVGKWDDMAAKLSLAKAVLDELAAGGEWVDAPMVFEEFERVHGKNFVMRGDKPTAFDRFIIEAHAKPIGVAHSCNPYGESLL